MAGGTGSGISKGGMITKVRAAQRAARSGADTLIVSGHAADSLLRAVNGEEIGTLLYASESPLTARKQWLADHLQLAGSLILDDGAVAALVSGRSLLAVGVKRVEGEFERGAAVACLDGNGREIARGLINYSGSETRRRAGHATAEFESLLGYLNEEELIHRDNLILL
jgi:glutamate 5-kinase